MKGHEKFAIIFSTAYLVLFISMLHFGVDQLVWLMFASSPFVVIYTVYAVLKYGTYTGRELKKDEEWAYSDKKKENLGTF